jgi:outer membrane cobalamin receptor
VAVNQSLSVTLTPSEAFDFNATFFLNRLKGRISYVRELNSGVGSYKNLGRTVYRGVDLSFGWRPLPALELKGSYTYLEARDLDLDKFLTSLSRNSWSLEAIARPVESFTAAVKADYQSRTYVDRENTRAMSSRLLWSLRAEKSFGPWVIFLDGENIFDKEYYYVDGLRAPPRRYFMGVKYAF